MDVSKGLTIGVYGAWGSGKTSFVNLAKLEWQRRGLCVLDFNPWMFSGTAELVDRFFDELSMQMSTDNKLRDVWQGFRKYGKPLGWLSRILSIPIGWILGVSWLTGLVERIVSVEIELPSSSTRRDRVSEQLGKLAHPIVVVLDDVDRLSIVEIRQLLTLVRLTASFPNVVYVLICDRKRVEMALGDEQYDGRAYLEKIVQRQINIPAISAKALSKETDASVRAALLEIAEESRFDQDIYSDVYWQIVQPLISNIRDVRRFGLAIRDTARTIGNNIELSDIIGLEAIRLFLPDVFELVRTHIDGITVTSVKSRNERRIRQYREESEGGEEDSERGVRGPAKEMMCASGDQKDVVHAMLRLLFPASRKWLGVEANFSDLDAGEQMANRRVSHEYILRHYLERVCDEDLMGFHSAEQALMLMGSQKSFDKYLRNIDAGALEDLLIHLVSLQKKMTMEHVESGLVVLFNLRDDILEHEHDEFAGPQRTIRSIARCLIQLYEEGCFPKELADRIIGEMESLSSKVTFVYLLGHRQNSGLMRLSKEVCKEVEADMLLEIQFATGDALAEERETLRILWFGMTVMEESNHKFIVPESDKLTIVIVLHCLGPGSVEEIESSGSGAILDRRRKEFLELMGEQRRALSRIEKAANEINGLAPWLEGRLVSVDAAKHAINIAREYLET